MGGITKKEGQLKQAQESLLCQHQFERRTLDDVLAESEKQQLEKNQASKKETKRDLIYKRKRGQRIPDVKET